MKLPFKKTQDDKGGKQPAAPVGGTPLIRFWFLALAGVMLALVVGLGGQAWLDGQRLRAAERQRVEGASRDLGRRYSETLRPYHELFRRLSADPQLAASLSAMSEQERDLKERMLTGLIPGALRTRLLPPEHDKTDKSAQPPLSFASLALLRAAEREQEPPPVELHHAGTPDAHLAGAAALRDEAGAIAGLIHIAFDAKAMRAWVGEMPAAMGRIELQQMVDDKYVGLYANAAEASKGEAELVHPLRGSRLRLAHWPRLETDTRGQDWLVGLGLSLVVLLLAAMSLLVQYWRMRKSLDHDKGVLVRMLDESLAGRKVRSQPLKVRDFHDLMALLQHRLSRLQEAGPAKAAAALPAGDVLARTLPPAAAGEDTEVEAGRLPDAIFHPYDINGVVGETLTADTVREIGRAIGSQAYEQGQQTLMVARDARQSGVELADALIEGISSTGRDVIDLGMAPLPVLYFATQFLGSDSGVMVTGSHQAPQYNGLKVVMGGEPLGGGDLLALRERVERGDLLEGTGSSQVQDLLPDYIGRITEDVSIARPLKLVVDCGGGCAALVAPDLFRALGCELVELHCDVDGEASGHPADPSQPDNLVELQQAVLREEADLGLAFDGEGDRLGVVDSQGNIIWPDRLMMLLSADVLARHPGGDVVFDVKCSRALASQILQYGGRPVMWKSGQSLLKAKLRETGALLAGEWSGHILFQERWYGFDDAMYAGARLLEILSVDPRGSAEVFAELPEFVSTPELYLPVQQGEQYDLMEKAAQRTDMLDGAKLITIDGMRAELEDAWGLMRASNTRPALSFRFEADDEEALLRVQHLYRSLLAEIAPNLQAPF